MTKRIIAAVICIVMCISCTTGIFAATVDSVSVVQTGLESVKIEGVAAPATDITLVLTPSDDELRAQPFYLRQTKADLTGKFCFRVKLRSSDPDNFKVHLSGKGLDIKNDITFELDENFVPSEMETTYRNSEIEVNYMQIANVLYIDGSVTAGSGKDGISISIVGADNTLYGAAQQMLEQGEFERVLVLNPKYYVGADKGFLRVGGMGINIHRFEVPLYGEPALTAMLQAMSAVENEQQLVSAIETYGDMTGLVQYKAFSEKLYEEFRKYSSDGFASMRHYADCVRSIGTLLDRTAECISLINNAAKNGKWSIIRTAITQTYTDLTGIDTTADVEIIDTKELYLRMCNKVYGSIDDITKEFNAALSAQKTAERQRPESKKSDSGTKGYFEYKNNPVQNTNVGTVHKGFTDMVDAQWATEAVNYLQKNDIVAGDEGKFRPNDSITREEFVAMLMRTLAGKLNVDTAGESFTDMKPDAWYTEELLKARAAGIAHGYEDGSFGIGDRIIRADMAVMAHRAFSLIHADFAPIRAAEIFADYYDIPTYALDAIAALQQCGVLNGKGNSAFCPRDNSSRAEAAVVIWKLMTMGNTKPGDNTQGNDYPTKELTVLKGIGAAVEVAEKDAVTRRDFARMLAASQNTDIDTKSQHSSFADVKPEDEGAYAIEYVTNAGQMFADEAGRFYPDMTVTPGEVVCGLLVMLGYYGVTPDIESDMFMLAKSCGITDKVYSGDTITYDEICSLIYNTLHSEMRTRVSENQNGYSVHKNYYALERYFELRFDKGICTGNEFTTLTEENHAAPNTCMIDGKRFTDMPTDGLLGRSVIYYYDANDSEELVLIMADDVRNKSVRVYGSQIDYCQDGVFAYYEADSTERLRKINLNNSIDVIYNEVAYPEFDWSDFAITSGHVEFVDNNKDGKYDVAFIKEQTHMVVGYADNENLRYYDREDGSSLIIDDDMRYIFTKDGKPGNISEVRNNVLLSYAMSKSKKVVSIDETAVVSFGTVTAIGKDYIGIDSVHIPVSRNLAAAEFKKASLGESIMLYIANGECVRIIKEDTNSGHTGYLTSVRYDEAADYVYFRVVTGKNTITEYEAAKKMKIDGTAYEAEAIAQRLHITAQTSTMYNADFPYAQPIKFSTNAGGAVSAMDTMYFDEDEENADSLRIEGNGAETVKYAVNNKSMYRNGELFVTLDSACDMIYVPRTNRTESKYYTDDIGFANNVAYTVEAFNVDEKRISDTIFVYYAINKTVGAQARPFIVTNEEIIDNDGEEARRITYLNGKNQGTVIIPVGAVAPELRSGDVIKYRTDYAGEVIVADKCFSPGEFVKKNQRIVTYYKTAASDDFVQEGYRSVYGTVVYRDEGIISVTTSIADDENGVAEMENYDNYLADSSTVYYCLKARNGEGYDVSLGDYYDLISYSQDKKNASKVFMYIINGKLSMVCYVVDK